jgi:hypothetical protein
MLSDFLSKTLLRYALTSPAVPQGTLVDYLTLTYNGNQLQAVSDVIPASTSLIGFVKPQGSVVNEYVYNKNGAMVQDFNSGTAGISYNVLNLPGSAKDFARKLHLGKSQFYCLLEEFKIFGAKLEYDHYRKTYYYLNDFELIIDIRVLTDDEERKLFAGLICKKIEKSDFFGLKPCKFVLF